MASQNSTTVTKVDVPNWIVILSGSKSSLLRTEVTSDSQVYAGCTFEKRFCIISAMLMLMLIVMIVN